jgi:hypothetical protein
MSKMHAMGFSGAVLEYIPKERQKIKDLEALWSRNQGLIPAKLKKEGVPNEIRRGIPDVTQFLIRTELVEETTPSWSDDFFQLELWNDSLFSPSTALIELWRNGVEFHLRAAGKDASLLSDMTSSAMRAEFGAQIVSALIAELRFLRQEHAIDYVVLYDSLHFAPRFEISFGALFPIRPTDVSKFLVLLSTELMSHFEKGGVLRGEWGRVAKFSQGVVAKLSAKTPVSFEKANKKTVEIDL